MNAFAVNRDFSRVLGGTKEGLVAIWDVGTGELLDTIGKEGGYIHSLKANANFTKAIVGYSKNAWGLVPAGEDSAVLWDLRKKRKIARLDANQGALWVYPSPSFDRALVRTTDGSLVGWDLRKGRKLYELSGPPPRGLGDLALSADFSRVILIDENQGMAVHDTATGKVIQSLDDPSVAGHGGEEIMTIRTNADFTRAVSMADDREKTTHGGKVIPLGFNERPDFKKLPDTVYDAHPISACFSGSFDCDQYQLAFPIDLGP